jgi:hypothetical protein
MMPDRRYQAKLRPHHPDDGVVLDMGESAVGVWDTVKNCFVKRDEKTGEWMPE